MPTTYRARSDWPLGSGRRHGDRFEPGCGGTLIWLYARLGQGSAWTKAGRLCRRCGRFWPVELVLADKRLAWVNEP